MFPLRRTSAFLPLCLGALVFGCAEKGAVAPQPLSVDLSISSTAHELAQARSDSLARGLAIALSDVGVRIRLRDDLRDSPFALHALHLASYLRGEDGKDLAIKAAAGLGIGRDAFISLAESGKELELVMPRVLDRVSWEGKEDLDVTATPFTFGDRLSKGHVSEGGYDIKGRPTVVRTLSYSPRPYVIARPAELKFPSEPERLRAASPKRDWNTVSTPAEERALMRENGRRAVAAMKLKSSSTLAVPDGPSMIIIPCGQPGAPPSCNPPPPSPPGVGGGGATLPAAMTKSYCYTVTTTTDLDNDRIRDNCEAELASRLAPLLNIGNDDWVSARQPYWAISRHPDRPDNVQIFYALSYLRDGGYLLNFSYMDAHEGDSEFIILEVINATGSRWGTIEATLSVHFNAEQIPEVCLAITGKYCGTDTYYWDDLDYPQGPYPRIWSALGKHANYRNRAACESASLLQESCGGDYVGGQIWAPASRNLGNFFNVAPALRNPSTQLLSCTNWVGLTFVYGYFRTGQECFWDLSNDRFNGWDPSRPDAGVTPYWRMFELFRI